MPKKSLSAPKENKDSSPNTFVGRQAIFDQKEQIYAYELLFRQGLDNVFSGIDGDEATSTVISNSFFDLGINRITGGKKATVNFTRNALLGNFAQLFPKEMMIVEILEDVEPDQEVVQAVRRLKEAGYRIALDDFEPEHLGSPLIEYADIIKVDVVATPIDRCGALLEKIDQSKITFLAEKVETPEEFQAARELGFSLFQGYFFCKPSIVTGKRIPDSKVNQIRLLREVNRHELAFDKIEDIIKQEISLSYKLLKFVNSARFGLRYEVRRIRDCLNLLGPINVRKWISLAALSSLGVDKPPELVVTSMVRARFCELLSGFFNMEDRADELFLLGMFSTIDALLDMPMERIVKEVGLAPDLKAALLGEPGPLVSVLNLAVNYERGDWDLFEESKKDHVMDETVIPSLHLDAVMMADELLTATAGSS